VRPGKASSSMANRVVQFGAFPGSYFGGATLDDLIFTKKAY
jgi:hypothetical protein